MLKRFIGIFLDFIVPPRASERLFRTLTLKDLQTLVIDNEGSLPYADKAVRALVWELKYQGDARAAELAGKLMSDLLLAAASEELGKPLLIPIPMHPSRRKERGYNQTELLCEHALRNVGDIFEYVPNTLERTRLTAPQQGLPQHVRLQNVKNSMRVVDPDSIAGRSCIVVDDVSTTGATFEEARRALREAGARSVECISLARS